MQGIGSKQGVRERQANRWKGRACMWPSCFVYIEELAIGGGRGGGGEVRSGGRRGRVRQQQLAALSPRFARPWLESPWDTGLSGKRARLSARRGEIKSVLR